MNKGNIPEIISLFRQNNDIRPILLLGAGASFRSGIPLASDATIKIIKASYAKSILGINWKNYDRVSYSDWLRYIQSKEWFPNKQNNFAEVFPLAVKNLLTPADFRREVLIDMVTQKTPSNGYKDLAEIIQRQLCWTILTTNFDALIAKALIANNPNKNIFEINRVKGDLPAFNTYNKRQIVYLHGALEFYTDKILEEETKRLDDGLVAKLRPTLDSSPLIIIGYRGAEESIMTHLLTEGIASSNQYAHGIYWCLKGSEEPHELVSKFAQQVGTNFKFVSIEGFDEFVNLAINALKEEYVFTSENNLISQNLEFDEKLVEGKTYDDLDEDLIKITLKNYFSRMNIVIYENDKYKDYLISENFLCKKDGRIIPTNAAFLLFGKDINRVFPYAKIKFEKDGRDRIVFDGNLLNQFNQLQEFLNSSEINTRLRIKKEKDSDEINAFHPRALTELLVNMIVHRDYTLKEYSEITQYIGTGLTYLTPGGLPNDVLEKLTINKDGTFDPIRDLSKIRNRLIADIFYGIGAMDKAGSGMPDVKDLMIEHSGRATFKIIDENKKLSCTLLQALQKSPKVSNVAQSIAKTELYITNLIPFKVIPENIYLFPTKNISFQKICENLPLSKLLPIYITDIHTNVKIKKLISFSDLEFYADEFNSVIDFSNKQKYKVKDFILDYDYRKRFSWLVMKHWEFHLFNFKTDGLFVDYKKKRAYFELLKGIENKISYVSRLNRKATRAVVKRRETPKRIFHENEGISYLLDYIGKQWVLNIKPIYVFTKEDGKKLLESYYISKLSTSRFKFDRNKMVDDDLNFWLKYISQNNSSINIGGNDLSDLILEGKYIESEIPVNGEVIY